MPEAVLYVLSIKFQRGEGPSFNLPRLDAWASLAGVRWGSGTRGECGTSQSEGDNGDLGELGAGPKYGQDANGGAVGDGDRVARTGSDTASGWAGAGLGHMTLRGSLRTAQDHRGLGNSFAIVVHAWAKGTKMYAYQG